MSTTSEGDWRRQALQNMERADIERQQLTAPKTGTSLWTVFAKIALLIVLAIPLMMIGYSMIFAVVLVRIRPIRYTL